MKSECENAFSPIYEINVEFHVPQDRQDCLGDLSMQFVIRIVCFGRVCIVKSKEIGWRRRSAAKKKKTEEETIIDLPPTTNSIVIILFPLLRRRRTEPPQEHTREDIISSSSWIIIWISRDRQRNEILGTPKRASKMELVTRSRVVTISTLSSWRQSPRGGSMWRKKNRIFVRSPYFLTASESGHLPVGN